MHISVNIVVFDLYLSRELNSLSAFYTFMCFNNLMSISILFAFILLTNVSDTYSFSFGFSFGRIWPFTFGFGFNFAAHRSFGFSSKIWIRSTSTVTLGMIVQCDEGTCWLTSYRVGVSDTGFCLCVLIFMTSQSVHWGNYLLLTQLDIICSALFIVAIAILMSMLCFMQMRFHWLPTAVVEWLALGWTCSFKSCWFFLPPCLKARHSNTPKALLGLCLTRSVFRCVFILLICAVCTC